MSALIKINPDNEFKNLKHLITIKVNGSSVTATPEAYKAWLLSANTGDVHSHTAIREPIAWIKDLDWDDVLTLKDFEHVSNSIL